MKYFVFPFISTFQFTRPREIKKHTSKKTLPQAKQVGKSLSIQNTKNSWSEKLQFLDDAKGNVESWK